MRVFCSASRNETPSLALRSPTISKISSTSCGASPIEGSSSRIIFGRDISARPIAHICCSPPEIYPAVELLEPREIGIDEVEVAPDGRAAVAARERAGEKVLLDRQVREAMAPLHHLDAAPSHELIRRARMHLFAVEDDGAFGYFPAFG